LVADPYSPEIVTSRLKDLLDGKEVGGVPGISRGENRKEVLYDFVHHVDWTFKPEAFDAVWHAVFSIANKLWCTRHISNATYWWTEEFLLDVADDALSAEGSNDGCGSGDGYDNVWIATSLGAARLYALGYGYSPWAWNSFLDGLELEKGSVTSDSMRVGSCGQLLGAGQRLKLRIHGGGSRCEGPGFGGRYLKRQPPKTEQEKKEGEEFWQKVLKALEDQQQHAGAKAGAILKTTLEHLKADVPDMTSIEVVNIIWPKSTT
jgi:hypothetical protein